MILLRVGRGVADHFLDRYVEWIFSVVMVWWGWEVSRTGNMLTSEGWAYALRVMPENAWGIVAIINGSLRLAALTANGTFAHTRWGRWSPHARAFCSGLFCAQWAVIWFCHIKAGAPTPGYIIYGGLAVMCLVNALRASSEAARADLGR